MSTVRPNVEDEYYDDDIAESVSGNNTDIQQHIHKEEEEVTQQEPNYQIKPRSSEQFPRRRMQAMLEHTITGRLEGEEYDAERAPQMTREIVELIQRKVIDAMHFFESDDNEKKPVANRYRLISHVHLGENCNQGIAACTRTLCDPRWDMHVHHSYTNQSLICVAIIYAVYKT